MVEEGSPVQRISRTLIDYSEEELIDEEISKILQQMQSLQGVITQKEHLNRMLKTDHEWLDQRQNL